MKRADCPLFTVLTPTYNRASTLPCLYASLCRQSFQDFEWLVIDDGSSDDTRSLINALQAGATFCIRYRYQPNAGKHVAFNVGVAEACGSWIAEIDSDDELLPQALQTVSDAWHGIPAPERASFVGVTGLCLDDLGRIVGNRYPSNRFVANTIEAQYKYGVRGEKWGVHRRDVLREFPFPVPPGLKYMPECIVWPRIARKYRTLYINEPLRLHYTGASEKQLTKRKFPSVAQAALLEHQCVLNSELQWFFCSIAAVPALCCTRREIVPALKAVFDGAVAFAPCYGAMALDSGDPFGLAGLPEGLLGGARSERTKACWPRVARISAISNLSQR